MAIYLLPSKFNKEMLTLSREADYAVRLVVQMATATRRRFRAKDLAEEEKVPESFLFKILQLLIKHRLVRSFRGVHGGYQLVVDPAKLTLFRLLEMVEGPIGLNVCVMTGLSCPLHTGCGVHDVWVVAQAQLRRTLEGATVAELARRTLEKRSALIRKTGAEPPVPYQPPPVGSAEANHSLGALSPKATE